MSELKSGIEIWLAAAIYVIYARKVTYVLSGGRDTCMRAQAVTHANDVIYASDVTYARHGMYDERHL